MPLVLQQDFDCACLFLCHSVERPNLLLLLLAAVNYFVDILRRLPAGHACHR